MLSSLNLVVGPLLDILCPVTVLCTFAATVCADAYVFLLSAE